MQELIPLRWPGEWRDSATLDLIKGSPINCLVGDAPPPFPIGGLKFVRLDKNQPPEGIVLCEGVWPRVLPATKKDAAEAGATGGPWVDSNAGAIRLAQTMNPGQFVWVDSPPPGGNEVVAEDAFSRAIAEAEAHGAHWIVTLTPALAEGLAAGSGEARRAWKRMTSAMNFFAARREWRTWEPVAALTVVSPFDGESKLLSEEFVKLAPRRHLACRILRSADASAASFSKQKAVLYLDSDPPSGDFRRNLLEFAQAGGLLIAPRGMASGDPSETKQGYHLHRSGKGLIAVPREAWYDPFSLVDDIQILLSHREDVVRVWNGGDMNSHFVTHPKGGRGVVHLIPYASGRSRPVTIGLNGPYRSARVLTFESQRTVQPVRGELGIEIPVGEFSSYAAVEVGI
jgi:hypothetical protein